MPTQTPYRFNLSPFGKGIVREIIHKGNLFTIYRVEISGQEICIKAPSVFSNSREIYGSNFYGIETSIYSGSNQLIENLDATTEKNEWIFKILLLEGELVRWTNGAWNHWVIGFGTWDGLSGCHNKNIDYENQDNSWSPYRFIPIMLMPHYPAIPLSAFSFQEQRELFPRILPSLWDALCAMHHGDLSQSNILINKNENIFHLIDPGVVLSSTASENMYANNRSIFTTNAANYPLIPPFKDISDFAQFGDNNVHTDLLQFLKSLICSPHFRNLDVGIYDLSSRQLSWTKNSIQVNSTSTPHPADLLALGIIYYRILTGNDMFLGSGIMEKPAWQGEYGELFGGTHDSVNDHYERIIDFLAKGYIDSEIDRYQLKREEKKLVYSLLNLRLLSKNDLLKHCMF